MCTFVRQGCVFEREGVARSETKGKGDLVADFWEKRKVTCIKEKGKRCWVQQRFLGKGKDVKKCLRLSFVAGT